MWCRVAVTAAVNSRSVGLGGDAVGTIEEHAGLFSRQYEPAASGSLVVRSSSSPRRPTVTEADVHCGEGRQITFVQPDEIDHLALNNGAWARYRSVVAAHPSRSRARQR